VRPKFLFQKIFSRSGKLFGIELLARDFTISPFTDLHIFYCALEEVAARNIPVPVHVNLYASSVRFVNWNDLVSYFGSRIVVELVERDVQLHLTAIDRLIEAGIPFALDDFGNGSANYSVLREVRFPIVKVDLELAPPSAVRELKRKFGVECVIAEKAETCPQADAFQSFSLHYPEPLDRLEESLALEKEA